MNFLSLSSLLPRSLSLIFMHFILLFSLQIFLFGHFSFKWSVFWLGTTWRYHTLSFHISQYVFSSLSLPLSLILSLLLSFFLFVFMICLSHLLSFTLFLSLSISLSIFLSFFLFLLSVFHLFDFDFSNFSDNIEGDEECTCKKSKRTRADGSFLAMAK